MGRYVFSSRAGSVGMSNELDAVSPLDGRYAGTAAALAAYASEAALMRARVRVEIEYLVALADVDAVPLVLDAAEREACRAVYEGFDEDDAGVVKQIETTGYGEYPATNHDVKAVEYFIRDRLPESLGRVHPWVHFGLTSEDVTNLAYRLLVRGAVNDVLLPSVGSIRGELAEAARVHRAVPMLSRTHGQPATPTTWGKELAVYAGRIDRAMDEVAAAVDGLVGKFGGASGTFAAHVAAFPEVDWPAFARSFVEGLGFGYVPLTTQINPGDDLAGVFHALQRTNQVLVDLDRDVWLYVSDGYLRQRAAATETGSSTMPHKVNPIDFENSEGNLSKANADLGFLAGAITTSRLQRDLTDSTVKRNIGAALAHCYLGYEKTRQGLVGVEPDEAVMREDLESHPVVVAEAYQTILRREGDAEAYERVKDLTRGREVSLADLHDAIDELDVAEGVREELRRVSPAAYVGVAADLVDEIPDA